MFEFKLPDVGEGLTEAEIVSWKVQVGDVVAINDVVVEIETAKSLVELPSPYAGTVVALLVQEGQEVQVGTPIIAIGDPVEVASVAEQRDASDSVVEQRDTSDSVVEQRDTSDSVVEQRGTSVSKPPPNMEIDLSNPAASGGGEGESLVGRMKADRGAARRPRRKLADAAGEHTARAEVHDVFNAGAPPQREKVERIVAAVTPEGADDGARGPAAGAPQAPQAPGEPAPSGKGERVLAKPPVRKLARDLGVDLASIEGSGADGIVTRDDVQAAASGDRMPLRYDDLAHPGVSPMAGAREIREPIKGVRKMMAQAMVSSAFSAPHVTEWITVDVTRTMEFVERLRTHRDFRDVKVSPLLVLARACVLAMRRTPVLNSFWDDSAGEVVLKGYVNLGIAAATPRGLVVPNVKDADAMSLRELAVALNDLTAVAKEGKTQPADMAAGTFTITNVGVFGVDAGTPIINPGESAILCFGAVKKQPWVVTDAEGDDELAIRHVTTLALSFDHRHIDGEAGSRFLADVAAVMEDPATALLY